MLADCNTGFYLPVLRTKLILRAKNTVHLPAYQGSTWRGIFGHCLKRTVCVMHKQACQECALLHSCPYPYIFETPISAQAEKMRRYTHAPHPFVFELPWHNPNQLEPGDTIEIGINLFGNALQNLPYIIAALQKIETRSIGRSDGRFELVQINLETGLGEQNWINFQPGDNLPAISHASSFDSIPAPPDTALQIELHTPLRLTERNRLVRTDHFRFHHLFRNLLRRLSMLTYFHTNKPFETDFAGLSQLSRDIELHNTRLRWYDWTRYSNRQKTTMQMGGLRGTFIIRKLPEALWPMLWTGQWIHAGKAAVMGLGHYTVSAASLPSTTVSD